MTDHTTPNMTDIVFCSRCGRREFYGHLTWSAESKPVCRACIHDEWQKQDPKWDRTTAPIFPAYTITWRGYKTKDQQVESLRAAQALINAAIDCQTTPQDSAYRPAMLHSAHTLIQDAAEWLEELDE